MMKSLDRNLACEIPLLSFIFLGKVHEKALPPYLSGQTLGQIRPNLDRLTIKTADVICYLESVPENSLDRFSLSDVASYLDHAHYLRLLRAILRTAKPNSRFCLRQLMTRYSIPEGLRPYFVREANLEKQLENDERDFLYQFMVGKIVKHP
jgi:S-adenosylmethionine-diacylglycerol 3-amino-3-carboxypropyl transferase